MMQNKLKARSTRYKKCRMCVEKADHVNFKDSALLRQYMTERGKILSRRITGMCSKHQRRLAVAIKRAQTLALVL